jgi:NTP pyrophosphatase (non-canonical NTP hydrolase)
MNTFDEYQEQAVETSCTKGATVETIMMHCMLGLTGEVGEIAELIKKEWFHQHARAWNSIREEIGDVLWYLAVLADGMGVKLSDLAEDNIVKLRKRYPDGFDRERSKH